MSENEKHDRIDRNQSANCPFSSTESACRDRLRILDSQIEALRYQLAKALAMNRLLLRAIEKVSDFKDIDKELARLTAKILQKEIKGPPHDDEEDINKKLSGWH